MKKLLTFIFIILIGGVGTTNLFGQAGTVTLFVNGMQIGTTYASISGTSGAWAALKLQTVNAGPAVIELSSGYDGSSESAVNPAVSLDLVTGASATNTITIRPALGATVLSYTTNNLNYFKFQTGAVYITLDGRAGGIGTSQDWTIQVRNTGTSSTAIYLTDAQYCTIQYCKIQTQIPGQTAGVIRLQNTGATMGTSYNKFLHCDISSYYDGTNYVRTGLYSLGTVSYVNTNNEIGYCNFYNYASTGSASGILIRNYNSYWNIHDNSFYMTVATALSSNNSWSAIIVDQGASEGTQFVNNYIGGTAPQCGGSAMSLGGDCSLQPIKFAAVTLPAKNTVTGNTIKNISFTRANSSSSTSSLIGLAQGDFNDVSGNVIQNITGIFSLATHTLRGIEVTTTTPTSLNISQNKIIDPNFTGTGAQDGIYVGGTNATIVNNMISIGASTSADAAIRGIYIGNVATTNTANVYFNSVDISGSLTSGSANTVALSRVITSVTGTVVFKNNILYNTRSGGTGNHAGIVSSTSNLTSDYNNIYSLTPSTVGSVDGTNFTNFANWQSNSGQDANSKSAVVYFISATDLHLTGASLGDNTNLSGTPITGITTDIDGDTRLSPPFGPYKGADEASESLPIELSSFTSNVNGRNVFLNWQTKTEVNSNKFVIERALVNTKDAAVIWVSVGTIQASGTSYSPRKYSYTEKNIQVGKYQYRLKMIDNDGSYKYSNIVETEIALPKNFALSQNYPNPFNPSTKIDYQVPVDSKVILEVYNIVGQKVIELINQDQSAGYYTVDFGSSSVKLSSGVYIYRIVARDKATGNNFSSIKKMMLLK